jgi:hypothetical protein
MITVGKRCPSNEPLIIARLALPLAMAMAGAMTTRDQQRLKKRRHQMIARMNVIFLV